VPSWLSLGILWLNRECILPECSAALDPIETTDMTTSHLTNPAKDAGQVIGYSHSTRLSKDDNQVAGYVEEADKIMSLDPEARVQKSGGLFPMSHGSWQIMSIRCGIRPMRDRWSRQILPCEIENQAADRPSVA
jgi:hypothetical protein